jgi:hypothetical protein
MHAPLSMIEVASLASDSSSAGPFGVPRFVVRGLGILLLFLVSFAAGFVVGARPVADLTQRVERAGARAEESEGRAAELDARLHAYRALALLHQAIADVDARNFGTANQRLDEVVAALDSVNRELLDTGAEELEAIRNELAEFDVRVAGDLAGQRATLSTLAQRLTEALSG